METTHNKDNLNTQSTNDNEIIENNDTEGKIIYFDPDNLLDISDNQLIDITKIEEKVLQNVNNYKSEEYSNYLKILKKIPKIFGKKTYQIEYTKDAILIYKLIKKNKTKDDKGDNHREILHKIQKPILSQLPNREQTKLDLEHIRNDLKQQYINYVEQDNVSLTDKSQFMKQKEEFINKLEEYYIDVNYYYSANNLKESNEDKHISVANYKIFMNEKAEYDNKLFLSHYRINSEIINEINQHKSDSLDKYNLINEQIELENNKELEKTIQEYLNKDDTEITKKLKKVIKQQNNMIDYKITKLPVIDTKLLNYL